MPVVLFKVAVAVVTAVVPVDGVPPGSSRRQIDNRYREEDETLVVGMLGQVEADGDDEVYWDDWWEGFVEGVGTMVIVALQDWLL
ncbi:hypothetical protein N657DRAFT_375710 [Parathielavia appendiculata]|uniref:Secreted protein n=1 Tax=Parathielavia appendiculata TaxID=2587402 RepID=A0AAN6TPR5_9PEZI|nr:hypothetical protein N657DRAFT_375710 [Parathielavia appendiculata]